MPLPGHRAARRHRPPWVGVAVCALLLGCGEEATLRITGEAQVSKGASPSVVTPIEPRTLRVRAGDRFGHPAAVPFDCPLERQFEVLAIPAPGRVQVRFTEAFVIAGEPIRTPSARNPIVLSSEPTCFRTRWYDAGVDLCIVVTDRIEGSVTR